MSNAVFVLPVAVSDSTMPRFDDSDFSFYTSQFELESVEHWSLNGTPQSLVGLKNRKQLSQIGNVTANDNFFSLKVGMSTNNGGLVSNISDSLTQTVCAVIRMPSLSGMNAPSIIIGSTSNSGGNSGSALFQQGSYLNTVVRNGGTSNMQGIRISDIADQWVFVALSESSSNSGSSTVSYISTTDGVKFTNGSTTDIKILGSNISLGSPFYSSTGEGIFFDYAEFIVFDKNLSLDEIINVHNRSKERMKKRGINLI